MAIIIIISICSHLAKQAVDKYWLIEWMNEQMKFLKVPGSY